MSVSIPSATLDKFTTFGDLLRFLRRRVSLTQTELAQAVGYGHTQISRLEQNLRLPDIPTIETRFIHALGLEDEPKVVARLLDLAAHVRREDAPALGLCPYKGLSYFDEADADLFVGREALVASLTGRILSLASKHQPYDEGFLAIVGASGSGKSSLVRAGLVPALRWNEASTDWHIQVLTPTAHPLESLAISLTAETTSAAMTAGLIDDFARDARSLQIFVKRKLGLENGSRLLLVVDQFEELFALCRSEEERTAFIHNLLTAASEADGTVLLVITLRADFYAHCANYPTLREALARHQEYIGTMNNEELRRAIEEPAQRGRWEFEPGLVDLLLHEIGHEPGALPLLSHALLETWQRRRGRTMTLSGYTSSGGVRGAIAETAETVFNDQFTPEQRTIARRIFLRLTELNDENSTADTRRRARFNELILKPEEGPTTHIVLKALADARLITTNEDSAEVAHEALIREWPTLRSWLEDNREGLRLHRHLTEAAQEWLEMNREADVLYRGARLAQAREWAASHADELNALEKEFLAASIELSEREVAEREAQRQRELELERQRTDEQKQTARQLQRRAVFLTSALIVAGVLAVVALLFSQRASEQTRLSTSRELAAASIANLNVDPERSILLALQAVSVERTSEAESALHQALLTSRVRVTLRGHTSELHDVAVSPDGNRIATAGQDGTARVWDAKTGKELLTLRGHDDEVWSVAFHPDSSQLVTASIDRTAKIWDTASGKLLMTLSGHTEAVTQAVFDPVDGTRVATASDDGTVRIWDVVTGEAILTLLSHSGRVNAVTFSPDGDRLASGHDEGRVVIWNASSGKELLTLLAHTDIVPSVAFNPDGTELATAGFEGTAKVWDVATGEHLMTFTGHHSSVQTVAFGPDGLRLLTASTDNTAKVWDAQTGLEVLTFAGHSDFLLGAAFAPNGTWLATASMDGTARVWDARPSHELLALTVDEQGPVINVAISPDGTRLATSGFQVWVWDLTTGERLYELAGHTGIVDSVQYSPDGKRLATASQDGTARIWDLASRREILNVPVGEAGNIAIAFSPDGTHLAATGERHTAILWDVTHGDEILRIIGHTAPVVQLAFHPDGTQLATVSENSEDGVIVWNAKTGEEIMTLEQPFPIYGLAFSPDGTRLATGSEEGMAAIWDVASGQQVFSFFGHTRPIYNLAFTPDGSRLATASGDGMVKLWDTRTGGGAMTLFGHIGRVIGVAVNADGTRLATAGEDGISRVYILDLEELTSLARSRLTRSLTTEECQTFLHAVDCPPAFKQTSHVNISDSMP